MLLVVAYHAGWPIPGGYVGVDVFFVVSGFVIGGLLARELGAGTMSLGQFYARRVRRLMPALAVMLVVVSAATTVLGPLGTVDRARGTARAAALVFANGYLYQYAGDGYFDDAAEANPLLHTWSLSVEEQFYLVLPILLLVAWRWRGRRGAQAVVAASCFFSLLLSVLFTTGAVPDRIPRPESLAFYAPFTRTWEFGAGVALALATRRAIPAWLGVAGAVAVLGSAFGFDSGTTVPGYAAFVPVIGAGLIIAAGEGRGVGQVMRSRPLVWVGDRSYSWYLWHWPALVWARSLFPDAGGWREVGAVGVSLVLAELSYRYVEERFRVRAAMPRRALAVGLVCVLAPAVAPVVLRPVDSWIDGTDAGAAYASAVLPHLDSAGGCDGRQVPSVRAASPRCVIPAGPGGSPAGRVVLVGDSTAGHLSEGVVAAASSLGYETVLATMSGCPFVDLTVLRAGAGTSCRDHVASVVDDLVANPPDTVFVATSTNGVLGCGGCPLLDPVSGRTVTSDEARSTAFSDALGRVLARLGDAGIATVLVQSAPNVGEWGLRECAGARLLAEPSSCGTSRDQQWMDTTWSDIESVEIGATADLSNVTTVATVDIVCGDGPGCATYRGGQWWYRDAAHLTPYASAQLAPRLADAIAAAVDR